MCQTTDYVLEFRRCATHFGGCVDLYIMCRTSAFGECATLRISSPEAARSSLENDRPPTTYTSIVSDSADSLIDRMRALAGSDSVTVTLPDETESSRTTDTSESEVATPRYSKRPSGKLKLSPHFSFLSIC